MGPVCVCEHIPKKNITRLKSVYIQDWKHILVHLLILSANPHQTASAWIQD